MYNNFNYTKQFDKHIKANMESSNQFDKIIKEICKNKCKMSKIRHSKRIREDKKLELADNIKNKEDELIHNLLYYVKYNQISDKSFVDTL